MGKRLRISNYYLIFGILFTLILLIIAIFGDWIAPYKEGDVLLTKEDPVTKKMEVAPFPPSLSHWLGTDERGIDLVSKIFRGAKYTLFIVVVVGISRILIALPIGLAVGWYSKYLKTPFSYFNRAWNSIPLFIYVLIILEPIVKYNALSTNAQIIAVWMILTIVGLPPLVETIRGHVERIKTFDFMEGVQILGGGAIYQIRKHVLPHLFPQTLIMVSMEMAQILWLLGQLGIFRIFLGGTLVVPQFMDVPLYYSITNEWGGLLGTDKKFIFLAPWIPLAPGIAFVYAIFSLTLLAEGIRRKFARYMLRYNL